MALESQGVQIRRAAATVSTLTTVLDVGTTGITWPDAGADFVAAGFTTDMWIATTDNTALKPLKAVNTTSLTIHGAFGTTGSVSRELTGYTMGLVGEITDFTGPGGAAAVIDVTSLDSVAKEKLVGLRDEGQLSLSLNFSATDAGQVGLVADRATRVQRKFVIMLTDVTTGSSAFPSNAYFNGYAMQYSVSGAVDNKISANAVIEIDGAVIWSTKVT
jgi:hypothetical protein